MISSVSNINFRGESVPVNPQDLINQPGKFRPGFVGERNYCERSLERGIQHYHRPDLLYVEQ